MKVSFHRIIHPIAICQALGINCPGASPRQSSSSFINKGTRNLRLTMKAYSYSTTLLTGASKVWKSPGAIKRIPSGMR